MLPMDPAKLFRAIEPYISHLMVDPLNYRNQVKGIYLSKCWNYEFSDDYAVETGAVLAGKLPCTIDLGNRPEGEG